MSGLRHNTIGRQISGANEPRQEIKTANLRYAMRLQTKNPPVPATAKQTRSCYLRVLHLPGSTSRIVNTKPSLFFCPGV